MIELTYPTSQDAWIQLNRALIDLEPNQFPGAVVYSHQAILYDVLINIKRSWIAPDWDFTKVANYTRAKWTSLVNNYIDRNHMEEILSVVHHRELKKEKNYNVSFHFSNQHDGGKGCLLTATFSRRYGQTDPIIHAVIRASEFYKRGSFDLLLLHRLGEEAWGEDVNFEVKIFVHQLWGGSDWLSLLTSVIPPEELFRGAKPGSFKDNVRQFYHKFKDIENIEKLNYHAHKRAAKVVQGQLNKTRVLARDCTL